MADLLLGFLPNLTTVRPSVLHGDFPNHPVIELGIGEHMAIERLGNQEYLTNKEIVYFL